MRRAPKTLAFLLILAAVAALVPADADAARQANRYSVVTLVNKTKFRIYYDYAWGEGETTWKNSIAPNSTYVHWWKFKRTNQNWAPYFYVRQHGNAGWYKLNSFFSPNTEGDNGREYAFMAKKTKNGYEITLHPRLYTD